MKNQITLNNHRSSNYDTKLNFELDNIYRHMNILSNTIIENINKIRKEIDIINNNIDIIEKKISQINKKEA